MKKNRHDKHDSTQMGETCTDISCFVSIINLLNGTDLLRGYYAPISHCNDFSHLHSMDRHHWIVIALHHTSTKQKL